MIDIVCRSLFPNLLERMKYSVAATACGDVKFYTENGNYDEMSPKIINKLGTMGDSDIILFIHDDIVFSSVGWDTKLIETMAEGYNVLGVVGTTKYKGGMTFCSGSKYGKGKYISDINGKKDYKVKIYSPESSGKVQAIDGMFIAVKRSHFNKNKFDEKMEFFWENDYALRSKCGIVDILVGHYKIPELYGFVHWPKDGRNILETSKDYFNNKWGFKGMSDKADTCAMVNINTYLELGQKECYDLFVKKYKTEATKC